MLCRFSFCLPVCSAHTLADILWPKRGRGFIGFSCGSHCVCPPTSFSSIHLARAPPFCESARQGLVWFNMPRLELLFRQHVKFLYSHASPWINSCLPVPGEGEAWDQYSSTWKGGRPQGGLEREVLPPLSPFIQSFRPRLIHRHSPCPLPAPSSTHPSLPYFSLSTRPFL